MLLVSAIVILVLNVGYGVRKIFDDFLRGHRAMAAVGVFCLAGVNALLAALIYLSISNSADL